MKISITNEKWTVNIKSLEKDGLCMVSNNGPHSLMFSSLMLVSCTSAIEIFDGREIFQYDSVTGEIHAKQCKNTMCMSNK